MKKNNKAFTLVELIVVITILAILGTIAFISLQGYSAQARDSRRVSDISNIKTSLELFQLNTGKYPLPDDGGEVSYSGELLWTQGVIGDNVTSNLYKNLPEKPIDPLHEIEYVYSTTNIRKEYELLAVYEGDLSNVGIGSNVYAAKIYKPKVSGNYNGLFIRTTNFIIPTPSIITSEDLPLDLNINRGAIDSMVVSGGNNLPNLNIAGVEPQTGGLDINLSVYEGSISSKSTDTEKENAITAIRGAYSGTTLAGEGVYLNVLSDKGALELANEIFLNKTTSTSLNTNDNSSDNTSFNSNYWLQENGIYGTDISDNKIKLKYTNIFTTMDPAKTGGANLLNDNYTVDFTANGEISTSVEGVSTGNHYWEVTIDFSSSYGGVAAVGVGRIPQAYASRYETSDGTIAYTNKGEIYKNGTLFSSGHYSFNTTGTNIVGIALNLNDNTISFYINGGLINTVDISDLGLTGDIYPMVGNGVTGASLVLFHLNLGQSSFSYNIPSGYSEGFITSSKQFNNSKPFYVTTSNNNQISLNGKTKINSLDILSNEPTNTLIRGLVSFDGRNTWKKWDSLNWVSHVGGLDDLQTGNAISELETAFNGMDTKDASLVDDLFVYNVASTPTFNNSTYSSNYDYKAFNDEGSNGWNSGGGVDTAYMGYYFDSPTQATKLKILSRHGTSTTNVDEYRRAPNKFELRASNSMPVDGFTEGTIILSVDHSGEDYWGISEEKEWIINTQDSYTHYWIVCLDKFGDFGKTAEYGIADMSLSGYSNVFSVLDFAFDLSTTDGTVTPEISGISINME